MQIFPRLSTWCLVRKALRVARLDAYMVVVHARLTDLDARVTWLGIRHSRRLISRMDRVDARRAVIDARLARKDTLKNISQYVSRAEQYKSVSLDSSSRYVSYAEQYKSV